MKARVMPFILRPWCLDDLTSLVKYANNFQIAKNLTDMFPHPYHISDGKHFLERVLHDNPCRIFAIDIKGEAAGAIGLHPQTDIHQKNMELGYWLAEDFWGHGIMTEAIKQQVAYGFKTFPINRIFARPFGTNKASQRVLEKGGFKLEGHFKKVLYKNGDYLDELIYAVRR